MAVAAQTKMDRYIICNRIYVKDKGKGSPYSITEHRLQELIPLLGSQPAVNVSQKTRQQTAITFRQARSYPRNS